jgi:sec-independent protein translocase protein TatA
MTSFLSVWRFLTARNIYKRRTIMFGLGATELIIILVIVLIIFGAGKLPEIGAGIGKGIKNFKKATSEDDSEPDKIEDKSKKA